MHEIEMNKVYGCITCETTDLGLDPLKVELRIMELDKEDIPCTSLSNALDKLNSNNSITSFASLSVTSSRNSSLALACVIDK